MQTNMQEQGGCTEIGSRAAFEMLKGLSDVQIQIHRSPDGDCVGGGYALWHILNSLGIRARVVCADPIPPVFDSITKGVTFADFEPKVRVAVDVADRKLFGKLPEADAEGEILLCIDHHVSNTHYAKYLHWNPEASAACAVIYQLMKDCGIPMTEAIAECLYTGIATDTGCFQFSNADADAFAAVADIKRQYPALPYAQLNRAHFVLKSKGRITLDARLMQNVEMSESGRTALIYLPYAWMEEFQLSSDAVDGVANLPMQIIGVEVGITCKQQADGSYRISMRGGDHADVSKICQHFGGGGHIKAGGCSIADGEPEAVCKMLMDAAETLMHGEARHD